MIGKHAAVSLSLTGAHLYTEHFSSGVCCQRGLFFSLHLSPPCPVSYPSPFSLLTQGSFCPFPSICTYVFCLVLVFCSPPQPLLRPLLRTLTCVNVALMTAQWHFSGQTESLLMKQKHLSPHRLMTLQRLATNKSVWTLLNPDSFCSLQKNMYVSYTVSSCGLFVFVYQWRSVFFLF